METPHDMKIPNFAQANSLIYRNTSQQQTSHSIANLTSPEKNIELKFIIISKNPPIYTKKDTITQCQIADETACMTMNLYN